MSEGSRLEGRRRFVAGLALSSLTTSATAAQPTRRVPPAIAGGDYQLVQDWTFGDTVRNDEELREQFFTRYIYANGTLDFLKDEWQRYRDNRNHVIGPDTLALVARAPQGLVSGKIESGMLRSKWHGRYGYFEARMKVPPARGVWPAFWLNPQDQIWPPEIDVMEIVNNGRDTTRHSFHFLHGGEPKGGRASASKLDKFHRYQPGFDFAEGFHDFAVLWEPGRVRHYVDDVLVVDREFRWVRKGDQEVGGAHVLVNLGVGGAWTGPPQSADDFPSELLIQHIRVWQA